MEQTPPLRQATVAASTTDRKAPAEGGRGALGDVELLRRMADGDSSALGEFYDLHAGTLFGLACRILRDAKEAEDVLQDVLLLIWDKAAYYDASLGRPLGWALTMARNKAIDRLRATQRRWSRLVADSETDILQDYATETPSAPEAVRTREQGEIVRAALAGLPAGQRQAIELAFFEGLTQTEVAAALNEPLGTVKARIRRGMIKLRDELGQHL